eukprot:3546746-Amphidinium_carterae.1
MRLVADAIGLDSSHRADEGMHNIAKPAAVVYTLLLEVHMQEQGGVAEDVVMFNWHQSLTFVGSSVEQQASHSAPLFSHHTNQQLLP